MVCLKINIWIESWHIEGDSNVIQNELSNIIRRVAEEILGDQKVLVTTQIKSVMEWGGTKGNEEEANIFYDLAKDKNEENFSKYNLAKQRSKSSE